MKLRVHQAAKEDVYRDIVRIPEQYRLDAKGKIVPEGAICKISTSDKTAHCIVRGAQNSSLPEIFIDERSRNLLGISQGDDVDFEIKTVGFWGQFWWAWNASDPAYRIAARLSLLSVVLGLIGLLLGFFSLRSCF